MRVKIEPSYVSGSIKIPPSKSMAHRAIICASLAQGKSIISNIQLSKDIVATIACMRAFGASIKIQGSQCIIKGCDPLHRDDKIICPCDESGSTLRFLMPLATTSHYPAQFLGQGRLLERPMDIYQRIFSQQNISYIQDSHSIQIQGTLKPDTFIIPGDISSQFISGFLFVLPLLNQESTLIVQEHFQSASYVQLTIDMLKTFGITIQVINKNTYVIPGNQRYQATSIPIEGDFSQMAFFGVLACLNQKLTCHGIKMSSHQGDQEILSILQQAGCLIQYDDQSISVSPTNPQALSIDIANCPDLGPILCVLASFSQGTTKILNAHRLRIKESDRIEAMETELRKWDVDIQSSWDTITIHGKPSYQNQGITHIDGHNDHRIVMAMTIFGLCALTPSIIHGAQAIQKSYPDFFNDIQSIHGNVAIF